MEVNIGIPEPKSPHITVDVDGIPEADPILQPLSSTPSIADTEDNIENSGNSIHPSPNPAPIMECNGIPEDPLVDMQESLVEEWFENIWTSIVKSDAAEMYFSCVEKSTLWRCVEGDSDSADSDLDEVLKTLIRCALKDELNGDEFKMNLDKLLERPDSEKSPVIRANLYSRLVAVAFHLKPDDISPPKTEKNKPTSLTNNLRKGIDRKISLSKLVCDRGLISSSVLSYLWGKLEEDDEIMTLIYASTSNNFKKYQVPYFEGYTVEMVKETSKLWLSVYELYNYHFKDIIDQIMTILSGVKLSDEIIALIKKAETVSFKDFVLPKDVLTDKNFIQANEMLWKELKKRGAKAGARLLWLLLMIKRHDNPIVGELIKELFNRPRDIEFKQRFLSVEKDYWLTLGGKRSHKGADQAVDSEGQSINIGLHSSHTDYNLLCWAARRGYVDLIWLVVQIYKPSSESNVYNYVNHVMDESDAWKSALWCATRHGRTDVIRELLTPEWITSTIDFNDYPRGWLPPLHLVALLGDVVMLTHLAKVESGANKKDYLGRSPLDYAMPFMSSNTLKHYFNELKHLFKKSSKNQKRTNQKNREYMVKKLLLISGVEERLKELYELYINQANTVLIGAALIASVAFVAWLQPPLGYTSSTPEPYVAIQGHRNIEIFFVFNTLAFFWAIATMLVGAEATLFVRDRHERTRSILDMRNSISCMISLFIASMLGIMMAFIFAGLAVLPPILGVKRRMIISLSVGGVFCLFPLFWIVKALSEYHIPVFLTQTSSAACNLKRVNEKYNESLLMHSKEKCEELCKNWDLDGDDRITATELMNTEAGNNKWELGEVREIMGRADGDGNDQLDYQEVKKIFMLYAGSDDHPETPSCRHDEEDDRSPNKLVPRYGRRLSNLLSASGSRHRSSPRGNSDREDEGSANRSVFRSCLSKKTRHQGRLSPVTGSNRST